MGKNDIFMFNLHLCPIKNINCMVVYRSVHNVHSLHISTHIYTTMLDLWYFFPSHLISAEHSTQIHTVKEKVTQDFTL